MMIVKDCLWNRPIKIQLATVVGRLPPSKILLTLLFSKEFVCETIFSVFRLIKVNFLLPFQPFLYRLLITLILMTWR